MFIGSFGSKRTHSLDGNLSLLFREEFGRLRVVGEVEEDEDADEDSRNTFEDEACLSEVGYLSWVAKLTATATRKDHLCHS